MVEPDEDRRSAYCPALESLGAATWRNTQAEELKHNPKVAAMILEELVEENRPIPEDPEGETQRTNLPSFSL